MIDIFSASIFIASDSGVFGSLDGGNNWELLYSQEMMTSIVADSDDELVIWAGDHSGTLFWTENGGTDWGTYNNTFTDRRITGIFKIPGTDTLIVATLEGLFAVYDSFVVGIDEEIHFPEIISLENNFPNPFNPSTLINYYLSKRLRIDITVYDVLGRKVKTLVEKYIQPGSHTVVWDGRNEDSILVPSGVYIYRMSTNKFSISKKMILIR